jgi:hypothetical protein
LRDGGDGMKRILYWEVMEIALRPYRKVDPEAASRFG